MKKILCFGDTSGKYESAIKNAMLKCPNIAGWMHALDSDDLPNQDDDFVFLKCDIHSDDFLRRIIAINKKLNNGEKFYLTHCAVFFDKSGNRPPFILTDAACVPMPDESQLTHIVQNAVSLFKQIFGDNRAPFISLISAGGDTNTKLSPLLHSWYMAHINEFPQSTLRIEQLDVALDTTARTEKHLGGDIADIIVVDNINTGNAIFKSLSVLSGDWEPACFLMGAKNTIILNSRSATKDALTHNILLACKN
jgi:phosphate acetyltransferase